MTQTLTDFFKDKRDRSARQDQGIDWGTRLDRWRSDIDSLYELLEAFLAEPLGQGTVSLRQRPRQIVEEHLGSYVVPELILSVGDERVQFIPRGRIVYGASGRIDVRGERGEAVLVVDDAGQWAVVPPGRPRPKSVPLDAETFAEVLRSVMRP